MSKLCECGCGLPAPIATYSSKVYGWIKGEPKRYIHNHHLRGDRNPNYNNGITFNPKTRWYSVYQGNKGKGKQTHTPRARHVMEQHLGRKLLPEEEVHHIDKNPENDDISNLKLFPSHSAHMREHLHYSKELLLDMVRTAYEMLGRRPTIKEIRDIFPDAPTKETFRKNGGGIIKLFNEITEVGSVCE